MDELEQLRADFAELADGVEAREERLMGAAQTLRVIAADETSTATRLREMARAALETLGL